MVRKLEKKTQYIDFPNTAPAANPVFFRTYSRKDNGVRETWEQVCDRTIQGLEKLGKLNPDETKLLYRMMLPLKSMPSGRWLWVGGTDWIKQKENFSGAYNCTSTNVIDWEAFGLMMDLAMQGCGTGAVLEPKYINQLPPIKNHLNIILDGEIGTTPASERREQTEVKILNDQIYIYVGDSRQGWVKSYQTLLEIAADSRFSGHVNVIINLSDVRPAGEPLKGFGGVANPVKLVDLYHRCSRILNNALGRQLTSVECCLLIDEAAVTIVAGNIRRCLPEDALVHTSKGLVPIRDVHIGDLVQTPLGFRRVVDKFDQGMQEVYEIETDATYPRATLNHKQAVLADAKGGIKWKTVSELTEGDRLQHNTQILTGTVTKLPEDFTATRPSQSRNAKSLIIPDLTPEIAWLIGLTQGDGYVALGRNKHDKPFGRIEWSMNAGEPELTAKLQAKIDSALALFGLTATHGLIKGENTAKSICSSMRLAEYFHRYIKQPNTPLVVPNFILQGSIDVRAAYLAGLMDSDGSIKTRPPHLVTSVYPAFIRQVGAVLSSLGIAARTKINHPQTEGWQIKYSLTLPALKGRYNDLIAPYSVKGALSQGLKMYGFTIPSTPLIKGGEGGMMLETYSYSAMRSMGFQGSRSVDANYERYLAESNLSLDIPVTVKGLGSYDYVQTFDIEVEEAHCFYCDGYLTHNSAGMRQGSSKDQAFSTAKDNLWQQDQDGNWRIDPTRDALRMANHTRVFHQQPSLEETINAVRKQYYSGEGAIQYAPEAILRANTDLFPDENTKNDFCQAYLNNQGKEWLQNRYPEMSEREITHRLGRYGLNPCGEIIGANFHCNLSEVHLNQIDPLNYQDQEDAFKAAALSVATLLNHRFEVERYRYSREIDPIVGVSFTGLFDFFVHAFGVNWLQWWEEGRPNTATGIDFKHKEAEYLQRWRDVVHQTVWEYCDRHQLNRPNRCTTVQPSGTKSLLTGASPGWHPPKSQRFIRRITFRKNDPVALACYDYGYSIVPSQSDKDENGHLLNDPFDPRCTEWLVEIPTEVSWANLPGADQIDIGKFSALAQFDFYMNVQQNYTTHNTSATIELRENEIEPLGEAIYEAIKNDQGYISAALLARFDDLQTFPRLPFEPIDKENYIKMSQEVIQRRKIDNFVTALRQYDQGYLTEAGPAGCDSDKCLLPEQK